MREDPRCLACQKRMGWASVQGYCSSCWSWRRDTLAEITGRECGRTVFVSPHEWVDGDPTQTLCEQCGTPAPRRLVFGLDRLPAKERTCAMWPTLAQLDGRRAAAEARACKGLENDPSLHWTPCPKCGQRLVLKMGDDMSVIRDGMYVYERLPGWSNYAHRTCPKTATVAA